jgi:dihydrofolate reductase
MAQVVCDISVSVDGYAAGSDQTLDKPFGDVPADDLHAWMFETPEENEAEVKAITDAGAFIMGRNMFSPGRGEWDLDWKGWWGDDPPYHGPVFVLTHHPREPLPTQGGTTFNFVTDGPVAALEQAQAAAGERNVAIAGGAQTINQFLAAGLIDELRLHIAPVTFGKGERLFEGVPVGKLQQVSARQVSLTTHLVYRIARRRAEEERADTGFVRE